MHWWIELSLVLTVVLVTVLVAPMFASGVTPPSALGHGTAIVDAERFFGVFHEATIQSWALHLTPLVIAANWWYGLMHFAVTAAVAVWLFRRHHDDYPLWRNTLAVSSVLALVTQAVWPATPPRLLAGAGHTPAFIDTLSSFSSLWSFRAGGSGGVANQFAAMPSMHCVWALWCACVLVPRVKHRWALVAAVIYPCVTVAAIVVTGNHYVFDALARVRRPGARLRPRPPVHADRPRPRRPRPSARSARAPTPSASWWAAAPERGADVNVCEPGRPGARP